MQHLTNKLREIEKQLVEREADEARLSERVRVLESTNTEVVDTSTAVVRERDQLLASASQLTMQLSTLQTLYDSAQKKSASAMKTMEERLKDAQTARSKLEEINTALRLDLTSEEEKAIIMEMEGERWKQDYFTLLDKHHQLESTMADCKYKIVHLETDLKASLESDRVKEKEIQRLKSKRAALAFAKLNIDTAQALTFSIPFKAPPGQAPASETNNGGDTNTSKSANISPPAISSSSESGQGEASEGNTEDGPLIEETWAALPDGTVDKEALAKSKARGDVYNFLGFMNSVDKADMPMHAALTSANKKVFSLQIQVRLLKEQRLSGLLSLFLLWTESYVHFARVNYTIVD